MRITDLIDKKKRGRKLTKEEISFFIDGYVSGTIPDYQASAFLMAIWFSGMEPEETFDLTLAMASSGDTISLDAIEGVKVDKHSTGGVADTTTLIVAPVVAACGGKVAKMSGRGLGHTGGTLDKLESIPGFNVNLTMEEFVSIVNRYGLSVIGQTKSLVPADKKLYALRDVTGTVDNLSLIASSIMSKKLAAGADAIVLDVKTGNGAFMQDPTEAEALAEAMVDIGSRSGRDTVALVTDMSQPLGLAIGNAIEVQEALEILRDERRGALRDVSLALAARMIMLAGGAQDLDGATRFAEKAISSGRALGKLTDMIEAQGGDSRIVDKPEFLPQPSSILEVKAQANGYIAGFDTASIGLSALLLGAGRTRKDDLVDPAVGIWMEKRLGDPVAAGEVLARFYINASKPIDEAVEIFLGAVCIEAVPPTLPPLVYREFSQKANR